MAQSFPTVTQNSYIDEAILDLQDRDDAVLTCFSGNTAPSNPFENLVWNDTLHKCLKWYHSNAWETILDYGKQYITQTALAANYQPLNSILTNYSITLASNAIGFITPTGGWIPINSFYLNKLNSTDNIKSALGLKDLAYESTLSAKDIANGSISMNKLTEDIITDPVYKLGDCIPSFNRGNKAGCIKLSKSVNSVFTIGATSSNSTYKGDVYKQLYQFIWSKFDLPIYTNSGTKSKKGSSWSTDWNSNKQLELPHVVLPEDNAPKEQKFTKGTDVNYKITKSAYYEIKLIGGGGGAAASSAGTWGHQSACSGASGAGFTGTILLNEGDIVNYSVGAAGVTKNVRWDWGWPPSEGSAGGNSVLKLNGNNLVTCAGGGGAVAGWERYSWTEPTGGSVTIHQQNKFSNTTSIKGADGHGTNSSDVVSVNGPFEDNYGKGGSAQAFGDNSTPKVTNGGTGYFSLRFIAPKEYGTTDSTVKSTLDSLYNTITYFMKY